MFMSEYNHTIDEKGRLIIPSKFREELGSTLVLTRGLDACLLAYPEDEWKIFEDKLRALPLTNDVAREFIRHIMSGAFRAELDKQGRINIPANLRNYCDLNKDVVLSGALTKFEIWNKEKWDERSNAATPEKLKDMMSQLAIYGI